MLGQSVVTGSCQPRGSACLLRPPGVGTDKGQFTFALGNLLLRCWRLGVTKSLRVDFLSCLASAVCFNETGGSRLRAEAAG